MTRLLKDRRIIRNGGKIAATIANARFVVIPPRSTALSARS
jgi:3-methyladenine DNA glycosylase Tag